MNCLSEKQIKILAFAESDYDALICDGSIRSGKTSIMSVAFVLWAMKNFNGKNFGICSKTTVTADRNVIKPLIGLAFIKERFEFKYSTNKKLEMSDGKHSNTFYIFGGRDSGSYQFIQGITLAGVLLDEVALMPRSFVDQALARCSVTGRKFWFNCNPEGQLHWFNQEWILEAERHNALHLHFTLDDNPSLDPKIKEGYENMYTGVFYDRYIKGLWVSAEGVIYAETFTDENKLTPKEVLENKYEGDFYVSCDFGIQNATVFLLWRKICNQNKYVCLREYYYSGREEKHLKTVTELVEDLTTMLDGIDPHYVIIDPSASALKVELRRQGYKVRDAQNEVVNGISHTSKLLQDKLLLFNTECKNTINEFSLYMWDETAADGGVDVPIKENDHCMDALRYFVNTERLYYKLYKKQETGGFGYFF